MVSIDYEGSQNKHSDFAKYGIKTWDWWCKKNNIDFIVCRDNKFGSSHPIWNKELICDIGKEYDKIGIVDDDTMVSWNTENIFDNFDKGFHAVIDNANLGYSLNSIENYGAAFWPSFTLNISEYFNAGVLFFDNYHLRIFQDVLHFYEDHKSKIDNWNRGGGKEQTILNYIFQINGYELTKMTQAYNLFNMAKNGMISHN